MKLTMHFWRIHARVSRRLWTDIPQRLRDIIAADVAHVTEEFKWFETKVFNDTTRLYEDANYYDNDAWTFKLNRNEQLAMAA